MEDDGVVPDKYVFGIKRDDLRKKIWIVVEKEVMEEQQQSLMLDLAKGSEEDLNKLNVQQKNFSQGKATKKKTTLSLLFKNEKVWPENK